MAAQILRDCKLWLAGFDLSGDMNMLGLDFGAELQENTTFGADTRSRVGGLKTVTAQHEGFWEGGQDKVDDVLFQRMGLKDQPMTVAPQTGAEGEVAYSFLSVLSEYAPGATVGEMLGFTVSGEASGSLVRGTVVHNATRSATGDGTAFQLGAAAAGQRIFAALHVIAASGTAPTLDVVVESDDGAGFASPASRITFAQAGAVGAQWASPLAGPVTDDWWRVSYTLGGASPSFTFITIIAIQ